MSPPRTPVFRLPKVHKEKIPLRQIISGNDSPTEKISEYLDYVLQPIVQKLTSYIKDTNKLFDATTRNGPPTKGLLLSNS